MKYLSESLYCWSVKVTYNGSTASMINFTAQCCFQSPLKIASFLQDSGNIVCQFQTESWRALWFICKAPMKTLLSQWSFTSLENRECFSTIKNNCRTSKIGSLCALESHSWYPCIVSSTVCTLIQEPHCVNVASTFFFSFHSFLLQKYLLRIFHYLFPFSALFLIKLSVLIW